MADVTEEGARASVDELTRGMADQARLNGALPPMRLIEEYAREVTQQSVAELERDKAPAPLEDVRKARVQLDELLDQQIFEDDLGTGRAIHRPWDPARAAEIQARQAAVPSMDRVRAQLVGERLAILLEQKRDGCGAMHYVRPEWAKRIKTTFAQVRDLAFSLGKPYKAAISDATDAIMPILDESNRYFGDWRDLRGRQLIFIPGTPP